MSKLIRRLMLLVVTLALFLTACAVGPDFMRPAAPDVKGYTPEPLGTKTASAPAPGGETDEGRDRTRRDLPAAGLRHALRALERVASLGHGSPARGVSSRRRRRRAGAPSRRMDTR